MSNINNPDHDRLLARPMKHKIKPRFKPFDLCKRFIRSMVPQNNQRLQLFSWRTKPIVKYTPPAIPAPSGRWVLQARLTPRLLQVLKPFVRRLTTQKKGKNNLGLALLKEISKRISTSLDNIYFHNAYSFMNGSNTGLPPKEIKYFFQSGDKKRLRYLATPKKIHPPAKLPERKKKNLAELVNYILKLARPKWVYKSLSQDSMMKRMGVSRAARNCVPNERIIELARNVPWKMVEAPFYYHGNPISAAAKNCIPNERTVELSQNFHRKMVEPPFYYHGNPITAAAKNCVPNERTVELSQNFKRKMEVTPFYYHGIVSDAALKATMTPRLEYLSIAKGGVKGPFKELPTVVTAEALKYEATPRIIKLAKPKGEIKKKHIS